MRSFWWALLVLVGCQRVAPTEPPAPPAPPEKLVFPSEFLWGTATAGFQIEMGCPTISPEECEDRNSDWYQWVTDPELIAETDVTFLSGDPVSQQPGSFELFAEDARIAKDILGANALRVSLEWSRLFPVEPVGVQTVDDLAGFVNQAAVDHYHEVFQALRQKGLTPLVTLNHYSLPLWLHDGKECHLDVDNCTRRGWLDHDRIIKEISLFSGFCAREFGAEIDLWATLNEPFAVILAGYLQPSEERTNPPGVFLRADLAVEVAFNMIEAHVKMYDAVHAEDTVDADGNGAAAEVALVHNMVAPQPKNPDNPNDVRSAEHLDYILNRVFLNATILGELDRDLDGTADGPPDPDFVGRMDYLGINYYTRAIAQATGPIFPEIPLFDFLPEIPFDSFPQGLHEVVTIASEYNVPIIITENGVSDPQGRDLTAEFLVPHLEELHRAIQEGADVRGYFYWSLMDNYEWNHGMTKFKFGLFAIDPLDPLKNRVPKDSVRVFQQIAAENGIPTTLRERFGLPAQ